MQWKEQIMKMMEQSGIVYHGRVGHAELHYEMFKSGIWAYPTDFTEISCITAMKAQALGAVPVCTNMAALEETVKNGVRVDVDITVEEGQKEYVESLIGVLEHPEEWTEARIKMMEWARGRFGWLDVAKSWDELFRINIQNPDQKKEIRHSLASMAEM